MKSQDLMKKHYIPCFNAIYAEAKCCVDLKGFKPTYEWVMEHSPLMRRSLDPKMQTFFPYECFYLSNDRVKELVNEHTKGLRGSWYYGHKFGNLNDPNWKENDKVHEKILMDFRNFEAEVSKDKSLSPYERRKKIKERALKDGFTWRVWDAESISMNIHLGPSPTCNESYLETQGKVYDLISPVMEQEASKIYESWNSRVANYKGTPSTFEIEQFKIDEATSFATLTKFVNEKCFNLIHDELNMDKFQIPRYIEHAVALWIMVNNLK